LTYIGLSYSRQWFTGLTCAFHRPYVLHCCSFGHAWLHPWVIGTLSHWWSIDSTSEAL